MNPTLQTIHARRSVRLFSGEDVYEKDVETILRAAMAAPSARNNQPWAFVVVRDRTKLNTLREQLPYAKMLDKAALAICVCGDPEHRHWVEDCSAATQNILLACQSLGLGAVWTALYPEADRAAAARTALEIPQGWEPLCLIPIGVSAQSPKERDNYDPAKVHADVW